MQRNQVKVGDYTLTVSMATLYRADKELDKASLPTVMDLFSDVLGQLEFVDGAVDLSSLSKAVRVIPIPAIVTILTAFLYPVHNMTEKKALDGPLAEGTPVEWIMGLFNALMTNAPQQGDVDDDGDKGEPEGNVGAG